MRKIHVTKRARFGAAAVLTCVALAAAAPVYAQQSGDGKVVFEKWCAPCHGDGPGKPGTAALQALYKGVKPALLEKRTDLTPEFTSAIVRTGVSVMPFFRKTEISDAELGALSKYLAHK